eukprot:m.18623 g.18623  ORF g.18623 m.18623 type:complete len:827 (+) comp27695_c0_seq2:182-2662(+)
MSDSLTPELYQHLREYTKFSQFRLKDTFIRLATAEFNPNKTSSPRTSTELGGIPRDVSTQELTFDQFYDFLRLYLNADVGDEMARSVFTGLERTQNRRRTLAATTDGNRTTYDDLKTALNSKVEETAKKRKGAKGRRPPVPLTRRESTGIGAVALAVGASAALPVLGSGGGSGKVDATADKVTVSLQDVICYLSLLEGGDPREKLELLFALYDIDDSGYLESDEFGCILDQMISVAKCLGWETSEFRPILGEMLLELDTDDDKRISKDEWMAGGLSTIPLLVLLGVETDVRDGDHKWRLKRFKSSTYCNFCRSALLGKQGFCCKLCRITVHERCVLQLSQCCVSSHVKSRKTTHMMHHHWVEGNVTDKCSECGKEVKSSHTLTGLMCAWCHRVLHNGCEANVSKDCDFGIHKIHIIPPTCIRPTVHKDVSSELEGNSSTATRHSNLYSDERFELQVTGLPSTVHPLVVFVNPKSGGKQGTSILHKFQYLLNPRQVFDLTEGGPTPGLTFLANVPRCRILCCGGDGTVGWVLAAIDQMGLADKPSVAVLPLGTGNDLARCLKWGPGYEGGSLDGILQDIAVSRTVMLDRWNINVVVEPGFSEEGDKVPYNVINNYFSLGVDASIAHKFHVMREKHPEKFNSRMRNKLWYFGMASQEQFSSTCKDVHKFVQIECDGKSLALEPHSLEGLAFLNIPSIYGGTALWGQQKKNKLFRRRTNSCSTSTDYLPQSMDDKLMEVVGIYGTTHMGKIKMGVTDSGLRLSQCQEIAIKTTKMLPMQIDGEPWMQPPCTITIKHLNQMPMLGRFDKRVPPKKAPSRMGSLFHLGRKT